MVAVLRARPASKCEVQQRGRVRILEQLDGKLLLRSLLIGCRDVRAASTELWVAGNARGGKQTVLDVLRLGQRVPANEVHAVECHADDGWHRDEPYDGGSSIRKHLAASVGGVEGSARGSIGARNLFCL
eukprot:3291785-Prymnesium_polylepis.1